MSSRSFQGKVARAALPLAVALALAACGGGGSGVRATPPPPAPPPPTDDGGANQVPFGAHLALTHADAAHAAGFTGAGVTIGFVDTGVNRNHPALAGRVLRNFVHVDGSNDLSVDDNVGHGTTVAMLAAGKPFGQWPGGIAPDATIVSSRIINDERPDDDGSGEGNEVTAGQGYGEFFASINGELADAGARIINNSWGGLYWDDPAATREFADAWRDFVVTRGGLVVFANGNAGRDPALRPNPSDNAALPSLDPYAADLEIGWLAVGALDPLHPDRLTDYSQACGIAMDYCLVAPGDVVFTGHDDTAGNPTYWQGSGTSYAAPLVSGAAAVVWSAFPYFDNDLVRQTLLGTAQDLGAPGVDAIFGHGLLDVGKAVKGPARFDWGDVTVSFAGTSTWSNQISGDGGLVKRGSGTLVLTQNSTYRGDTRIEGGTVQLGMGMTGSDFLIAGSGTLQGNGSITGDVRNDGHLVASEGGTGGHRLFLDGNYIQGVGGTLDAYLGRGLVVGGTATLEGGTFNLLGVTQGYTATAREVVLHANGGLTGTFDALTSEPSVFLDARFDYDADEAFLVIARLDVSAAAASMGLSTASLSGATRVEGAFDALDGGAIAAPAFMAAAGGLQHTQDAAAAERSLASLSGDLHATDGALALLAADGSRHELEARLDANAPAGAWAARLDGRRSLGAIGANLQGWMLGQELRAGGSTWGASVSRSHGTLWHADRFDRGQDVQTEGQLYAFHDLGAGAYLMGRVAFGRSERDLQREVIVGGTDYGVDSRYADRYVAGSVQAGWQLPALGGTLVPYAGAQRLDLQRGGFEEAGAAGFGLGADGSHLAVSQALLGTRYRTAWRAGAAVLDLHGRVEWQRTLAQDGAILASFTGVDAFSPIGLDAIGKDTAILGAGFGAHWDHARFTVDLDARRTLGQADLGAFANWSWLF